MTNLVATGLLACRCRVIEDRVQRIGGEVFVGLARFKLWEQRQGDGAAGAG